MIGAEVNLRGPLFSGVSNRIIQAMMNDITEAVAEEGGDFVRAGTSVFKAPTGGWEGDISVSPFASGHRVDVGRVYDRWLEGVSRKNDTTRFKGYGLFKKAMADLRRTVGQTAKRAAAPHIRRLN